MQSRLAAVATRGDAYCGTQGRPHYYVLECVLEREFCAPTDHFGPVRNCFFFAHGFTALIAFFAAATGAAALAFLPIYLFPTL